MSQLLEYRMYEDEYPAEDDLVVVQVKSLARHGVYCSLLEYNSLEGLIMLSELSRRRTMSAKSNPIQVGKIEICQVLKVDRKRGYIDLSKKRVPKAEVQKAERKWNDSKAVHSILRHVARSYNARLGSSLSSRLISQSKRKPYSTPHHSSPMMGATATPVMKTPPFGSTDSMTHTALSMAGSVNKKKKMKPGGTSSCSPPPLSVRSMPVLCDSKPRPGSTSPFSLYSCPLSMEILYKHLIWPMIKGEKNRLFGQTTLHNNTGDKQISMSAELSRYPNIHAYNLLKKTESENKWDELRFMYRVLNLSIPSGSVSKSGEIIEPFNRHSPSSSLSVKKPNTSSSSSSTTYGRTPTVSSSVDLRSLSECCSPLSEKHERMAMEKEEENRTFVWELLKKEVAKRMNTRMLRFVAIIEVSCFSKRGILSIKECFMSVLSEYNSSDDYVVKIQSLNAPRYSIYVNGSSLVLTPSKAYRLMLSMVKDMREKIGKDGGKCLMKKAPFFREGRNNELVYCTDRMSEDELKEFDRSESITVNATEIETKSEERNDDNDNDDDTDVNRGDSDGRLPELTSASDSSSSPVDETSATSVAHVATGDSSSTSTTTISTTTVQSKDNDNSSSSLHPASLSSILF